MAEMAWELWDSASAMGPSALAVLVPAAGALRALERHTARPLDQV